MLKNRRSRGTLPFLSFLLLFSGLPLAGHAQQPPSPPEMPFSGPGGFNYPHGSVSVRGPYWAEGYYPDNNYRYFIFEPMDPVPEEAPVVLFLHGYFAKDIRTYYFWIFHMAQKGYVVVWVQYDVGTSLPGTYLSHVLITWEDALKRLENVPFESHVRPERDESGEPRTAVVGHSIGGYLAMGVATAAAQQNPLLYILPRPKALVLIEPGGWHILSPPSMYKIPPQTRLLVLVSDDDEVVCKETAVNIWRATSQIPAENKDFLFLRSDDHGEPAQIANHYFPNTTGFGDTDAVDARDFYVTYKLSVGLLNCAMRGTDCLYGLGHGSIPQLEMGRWSDGVERIPLEWIEDPTTLETRCTDVPIPMWGADTSAAAAVSTGPGDAPRGRPAWIGPVFFLLLVPMAFVAWMRMRACRAPVTAEQRGPSDQGPSPDGRAVLS